MAPHPAPAARLALLAKFGALARGREMPVKVRSINRFCSTHIQLRFVATSSISVLN